MNILELNSKEKLIHHKELLKDDDLSPELEYFYSTILWRIFGDDDSSEITEYYKHMMGAQNATPIDFYFFSNENLDSFFNQLDVKGKRVMTVGSSGDQALYAIFKGAKHIDLIDLNIMTKVYVDLKIAAIRALSYEEFITMMKDPARRIDSFYPKFSHLLEGRSRVFWDTIVANDDVKFINEIAHGSEWNFQDCFNKMEFFSSEEAYNKLKHILDDGKYKLNVINAEFSDFPKHANGEYDLILLSNILMFHSEYVSDTVEFVNVVKKLYRNHLKEGGQIQVASSEPVWYEEEHIKSMVEELKCNIKEVNDSGIYNGEGDDPVTMIEKPRTMLMGD